jgi:hypothetical protein
MELDRSRASNRKRTGEKLQEGFVGEIEVGETVREMGLTFWRRNYFFNFSTLCVQNVNNTGTKQVRIMKQTAF